MSMPLCQPDRKKAQGSAARANSAAYSNNDPAIAGVTLSCNRAVMSDLNVPNTEVFDLHIVIHAVMR
ncbi:MAG: hypothetical protein ABI606_13745, partial [Rhodoferax sp.]